MEKYSYYVIERQHKQNGKTHATAERIRNNYNLLCYFTESGRETEIISVNACDTWKEAQFIADFWNQCAKEKNNNLY